MRKNFQSPIDIAPSKAIEGDSALRPLEISYSEDCVKSIANTGNSWKAEVDDGKASALTLTTRNVNLDRAFYYQRAELPLVNGP